MLQYCIERSIGLHGKTAQAAERKEMKIQGYGTRTGKKTAFFGMLSVITALLLTALCILPASASDITPDDTFEVTENLTGIEIASAPSKTVYDIGESLDVSGLKLRLKYNSGRTETVAGDTSMCSGFDSSSAGEKTVTVSYRGFMTSFKADVRIVTSVSVLRKPQKSEYFTGEMLDLNGLVLTVEYSAGPSETYDTGYTLVGGSQLSDVGEHTVTVEFMGKRASFTVTVKNPVPTDAKLTSLPTKTEYTIGDTFNGSGAAFTVTYSNGDTAVVSDGIDFSGFSSSEKGEVTVTAKWQGFSDTFTVTVKYAAHTHVAGGDREIVKKATCTETGLAVRYCKICGEVAESATLKKLEHTYGDWKVTKEPTASSDGEKARYCQNCGALQTMKLNMLSSEISDGKNGTVTAAGDYLFPAEARLIIKSISATLTADEIKKFESQANALGTSLAAVYSITFEDDGQAFTPSAKMTYKISVASADLAGLSGFKVLYGNNSVDATYSGGFITFTVNRVSGKFAIAGVKGSGVNTDPVDTTPTTVPGDESTATPPVTSSPETTDVPDVTTSHEASGTVPTDTDSPVTRESTSSPAVTTDSGNSGSGKVGNAVKTIIIVIIVIVVIGVLFELLYIYLKNKFML